MALIKCPWCSGAIRESSESCIHCGHQLEKSNSVLLGGNNMALVKCPWCGGAIRANSESCIHCGHQPKKLNSVLLECNVCGGSVSSSASACPHCGEPLSKSQLSYSGTNTYGNPQNKPYNITYSYPKARESFWGTGAKAIIWIEAIYSLLRAIFTFPFNMSAGGLPIALLISGSQLVFSTCLLILFFFHKQTAFISSIVILVLMTLIAAFMGDWICLLNLIDVAVLAIVLAKYYHELD